MRDDIFVSSEARRTIDDWFSRFKARIPVAVETRQVESSLGPTQVLVGGPADAPPLLLLHGIMASSAHAMLEGWPLTEHWRVYAVDIAGASPRGPAVRPDVKGGAYAAWLVSVLEALGLSKVRVVGVSWGGFVAIDLAVHAPERVEKLALVVPGGMARGSVTTGLCKLGWPMMRYRRSPTPERLQAFLAPQFTTLEDDDWVGYMGDAIRCFRLDLRPPPLVRPQDLAGFAAPTLVLGASDDVHFPGPKIVERAHEVFRNLAAAELLPDCKHAPPMTDAFRRELAGRLTRFFAGDKVSP